MINLGRPKAALFIREGFYMLVWLVRENTINTAPYSGGRFEETLIQNCLAYGLAVVLHIDGKGRIWTINGFFENTGEGRAMAESRAKDWARRLGEEGEHIAFIQPCGDLTKYRFYPPAQ